MSSADPGGTPSGPRPPPRPAVPTSAAPPAPTGAVDVFGPALDTARYFADLLARDGVTRGLIGPRETARLWDRHLVNCALVAELLPEGAQVLDVGSGAGLPGVVLAIVRPDLSVRLVDSLRRRTDFLSTAVDALGLTKRVDVITGRVEDHLIAARLTPADWVVARAVAPLDRLARWCLPLLAPHGWLLAMKGARAEAELSQHRQELHRLGASRMDVVLCGVGRTNEPARVVRVGKGSART